MVSQLTIMDQIKMIASFSNKPRFEDYIGLAADLALKFLRHRFMPLEDSEEYSVACVALAKAISKYNSNKSKFSTYAYACIKNALIHYVRHSKYEPDFLDPKDIEGVEEKPNCTIDSALLDLFLSEKNDRECDRIDKLMLREHYLQQLTLKEIAIRHGITKIRVKQRIDRAIDRIRQANKSYIGESDERCRT
jgi:RNA polymerase sigma factor (sigma-70 family)